MVRVVSSPLPTKNLPRGQNNRKPQPFQGKPSVIGATNANIRLI
jgi:hypothetical protein